MTQLSRVTVVPPPESGDADALAFAPLPPFGCVSQSCRADVAAVAGLPRCAGFAAVAPAISAGASGTAAGLLLGDVDLLPLAAGPLGNGAELLPAGVPPGIAAGPAVESGPLLTGVRLLPGVKPLPFAPLLPSVVPPIAGLLSRE